MDISTLLDSFASAFQQNRRLLSLDIGEDAQWAGVLLPQKLEGSEAINDSYLFVIDCLSANANIPLKNLLGLPARITVQDQTGADVVRFGVITNAQLAGSDGGFARYAITVEPPFSLLKLRKTSRVWQNQSVPSIVQQLLSEHQANNQVFARQFVLERDLTKTYPERSYTIQYRESDYAFVIRIIQEEGIAWRFKHIDGSMPQVALVLFDDAYSLPQSKQQKVRFHRSDATETTDGLADWRSSHQIIPGSVSMASYDYKPVSTLQGSDQTAIDQGKGGQSAQSTLEQYLPQTSRYAGDTEQLQNYAQLHQQSLDSMAKHFTGSGTIRGLQAGEWFQLDGHPSHDGSSTLERQFVVTHQAITATSNLPTDLTRQLGAIAPSLLASSTSTQGTAPPFQSTITAQRRGIALTPAYAFTEHAKPTAPGLQTATVVGPESEEVYTDEMGRIKIEFHWQRPQEHPDGGANRDENSSCWVRVAMPSAGGAWGHQFIPRVSQEVVVDFIEGDIDRPLVIGVVYNGSHPSPAFSGTGSLPGNKTLSGIKSKEHQGNGYNELLFDDTPGQVRAKLSSEAGKTQLNQGYLTQPRSNGKADARGEGFELRTDEAGTIRAAKGLLLSAAASLRAEGNQLDRQEALTLLEAAQLLAQSLGEVAATQLANLPETGKDNKLVNEYRTLGETKARGHQHHLLQALGAWEKGSNTEKTANVPASNQQDGRQPAILMSAPAGIAAATAGSMTVATGTNFDQVAERDTNQTSGRRWLHNAGESISHFVQGVKDKIALKQIAANGNIQIQAQQGAIEITGDKALTFTSVNDRIDIKAAKEITLTCGGARIRLAGNGHEPPGHKTDD